MQFLTCNSWQAGTENYVPREGTKCAIARYKKTFRLMCHGKAQNVPQDGTKCAIARHKNTFRQVPQEGTKCATGRHIMCHRTAHNVPQDGTKCAIARHKKTYVPREGTKRLLYLNDLRMKMTTTTTTTTTTKQSLEPVELRSRLKISISSKKWYNYMILYQWYYIFQCLDFRLWKSPLHWQMTVMHGCTKEKYFLIPLKKRDQHSASYRVFGGIHYIHSSKIL
jgi:hypothetical protein